MNASEALSFAAGRAVAVVWGGVVAVTLYLVVILLGPGIEGRWFPVVTEYRLTDFQKEPDGGVSFVTRFNKVRDCDNFGSSWYAADPDGTFVKLQIGPKKGNPAPPTTGPLGPRVSQAQKLYPPADAKSILAVLNHDCGLIWHTNTPVGPFSLVDGHLLRPDEL